MSTRNVIPHLAAIAVIAACAWLALWQVERAGEKRDLIERWNDRAPVRLAALAQPYSLPQPITGVGIWDPNRQVLIDNRIRNQRTGVHVLTPFRTADGRLFLVNRGWADWPARSAQLPDPEVARLSVDNGERGGLAVEIEGVLNAPPGTGLRLGEVDIDGDQGWPLLVTYFDHAELSRLFGETLQPAVIQLDAVHPAHLTGEPWKVVTFGPDRHIGYAMTWTSIAIVVAAIWLALTIRQARRRPH